MNKGRTLIITFFVIIVSLGGSAWGYNYTAGSGAGASLTTGDQNAFIGDYAGYYATSGSYNVAVGEYAGYLISNAMRNVWVGNYSGPASQSTLSSAADTVAVGYEAGIGLLSGNYNVFVGSGAGHSTYTGDINTFIGNNAGFLNVFGYRNTYLGNKTGYDNQSGNHNIFIGDHAGENEMGSYRLYIDSGMVGGTGTTKPLIYGEFDNKIVKINGTLIVASDERLKKNITPLNSSLENIIHLRGVSYEWKEVPQEGRGFGGKKEIGLIAQEVEKILPELVHTDNRGFKSIAYDKVVPVLIEAVKEQETKITGLRDQIQDNKRIERLEKTLEMIEKRLANIDFPLQTAALK